MRSLITTLRWDDDIAAHAESAMVALKQKHGNPTVVVGHTKPHLNIARIASRLGIEVHLIYPNIDAMYPPALDVATSITVASSGIGDFYAHMVKSVDNVVALDESDPAVLAARRNGKPVWFPITGNVIRASD